MTMVKRDSNSIWSLVREDRDIDDLIFAGELTQRPGDVSAVQRPVRGMDNMDNTDL